MTVYCTTHYAKMISKRKGIKYILETPSLEYVLFQWALMTSYLPYPTIEGFYSEVQTLVMYYEYVYEFEGIGGSGDDYDAQLLMRHVSVGPPTMVAAVFDFKYLSFFFKKMTGSPGQTRPLMWIVMTSSWEKICWLIFFQIPVGIWWHWVSRGHYLLVLGGNGSVWGSTDWYLIVLDR